MTYLELLSKRLQSRRVASDVIEGRRRYLTREDLWWWDEGRASPQERERLAAAKSNRVMASIDLSWSK